MDDKPRDVAGLFIDFERLMMAVVYGACRSWSLDPVGAFSGSNTRGLALPRILRLQFVTGLLYKAHRLN